MFTGLVEEVGTVSKLMAGASGGVRRITVTAPKLAPRLAVGDSIAVSGVCLTAVEVKSDSFSADLAHETIQRTSLVRLRPGSALNLELPVRAGSPLGGHLVQGHVDAAGGLVSLVPVDVSLPETDRWLRVEIPAELTRYVVEKGSIAIEGISLTVAALNGRLVTAAIIPHTYRATNLGALLPGDPVNIEVDILAKYAERQSQAKAPVTLEKLIANGF